MVLSTILPTLKPIKLKPATTTTIIALEAVLKVLLKVYPKLARQLLWKPILTAAMAISIPHKTKQWMTS